MTNLISVTRGHIRPAQITTPGFGKTSVKEVPLVPFSQNKDDQKDNLQKLLNSTKVILEENLSCYTLKQLCECIPLLEDSTFDSLDNKIHDFVIIGLSVQVQKLVNKLSLIKSNPKKKLKKIEQFGQCFKLIFNHIDTTQNKKLLADIKNAYLIKNRGIEINWVALLLYINDDSFYKHRDPDALFKHISSKISFENVYKEFEDVVADINDFAYPQKLYHPTALECCLTNHNFPVNHLDIIQDLITAAMHKPGFELDAEHLIEYTKLNGTPQQNAEVLRLIQVCAHSLFKSNLLMEIKGNTILRLTLTQFTPELDKFVKALLNHWDIQQLTLNSFWLFGTNNKRSGEESTRTRSTRQRYLNDKISHSRSKASLDIYRKSSFIEFLSTIPFSNLKTLTLTHNISSSPLHPSELEQVVNFAKQKKAQILAIPTTCFDSDKDYSTVLTVQATQYRLVLPDSQNLPKLGGNFHRIPQCFNGLIFPCMYSREDLQHVQGLMNSLPQHGFIDLSSTPRWNNDSIDQLRGLVAGKRVSFIFSIENRPESFDIFDPDDHVLIKFKGREDDLYDYLFFDTLLELHSRNTTIKLDPSQYIELDPSDLKTIVERSFVQKWWPTMRHQVNFFDDNRKKAFYELIDFLCSCTNLPLNLFQSKTYGAYSEDILNACAYGHILARTLKFALPALQTSTAVGRYLEILEKDLAETIGEQNISEKKTNLWIEGFRSLTKNDLERVIDYYKNSNSFLPTFIKIHLIVAAFRHGVKNADDCLIRLLKCISPADIDTQRMIFDLIFDSVDEKFPATCLEQMLEWALFQSHSECTSQFIEMLSNNPFLLSGDNQADSIVKLFAIATDFSIDKYKCAIQNIYHFLEAALRNPEIFSDHPSVVFHWICDALTDVKLQIKIPPIQLAFKRLLLSQQNQELMIKILNSAHQLGHWEILCRVFLDDPEIKSNISSYSDIIIQILSQTYKTANNKNYEPWINLLFVMLSQEKCPTKFLNYEPAVQLVADKFKKFDQRVQMNRAKQLLPLANDIGKLANDLDWDENISNMFRLFLRCNWIPQLELFYEDKFFRMILEYLDKDNSSMTGYRYSLSTQMLGAINSSNPELNENEQKVVLKIINELYVNPVVNDVPNLLEFEEQFYQNYPIIAEGLFHVVFKVKNKNGQFDSLICDLIHRVLSQGYIRDVDCERALSLISLVDDESKIYESQQIQLNVFLNNIERLLTYNLSRNRSFSKATHRLCVWLVKDDRNVHVTSSIINTILENIRRGLELVSFQEIIYSKTAIGDLIKQEFEKKILTLSRDDLLIFARNDSWMKFLLDWLFHAKVNFDLQKNEDQNSWNELCVRVVAVVGNFSTARELTDSVVRHLFAYQLDEFYIAFFKILRGQVINKSFLQWVQSDTFNRKFINISKKLNVFIPEDKDVCFQILSRLQLQSHPKIFYDLLDSSPQFLTILLQYVAEQWKSFAYEPEQTHALFHRILLHPGVLEGKCLDNFISAIEKLCTTMPRPLLLQIAKTFPNHAELILGRQFTPEEKELIEEMQIPVTTSHLHKAKEYIKLPPIPTTGFPPLNPLPSVNLLSVFKTKDLNELDDKESFLKDLKSSLNDEFSRVTWYLALLDPSDALQMTAKLLQLFKTNYNEYTKVSKNLEMVWLIKLSKEKYHKDLKRLIGTILLHKKISSLPEDPIQAEQFFNRMTICLQWIASYLMFRPQHEISIYSKKLAEISEDCETGYSDVVNKMYYLARDENNAILPCKQKNEIITSHIRVLPAIGQDILLAFGYLDQHTLVNDWNKFLNDLIYKNSIQFSTPFSSTEFTSFQNLASPQIIYLNYLIELIFQHVDIKLGASLMVSLLKAKDTSKTLDEFLNTIYELYSKVSVAWIFTLSEAIDKKEALGPIIQKIVEDNSHTPRRNVILEFIHYLLSPNANFEYLTRFAALDFNQLDSGIAAMLGELHLYIPSYNEGLEKQIILLLHSKRWAFVHNHSSKQYYKVKDLFDVHHKIRLQYELENSLGIYEPLSNVDLNDKHVPEKTYKMARQIQEEFKYFYNPVFIIDTIADAMANDLKYEDISDWFRQYPPQGFNFINVLQEVFDPITFKLKRKYIRYLLEKIGVFNA